MIKKNEWWKMFESSGRIEFYNAYRAALGEGSKLPRDTENGQES